MIGNVYETKGFVLTAAVTVLAPSNVLRKGLLLANGGTTSVFVAVGDAPKPEDFFSIPVGETVQFKEMVPVGKLQAKGPGTLVMGEVS